MRHKDLAIMKRFKVDNSVINDLAQEMTTCAESREASEFEMVAAMVWILHRLILQEPDLTQRAELVQSIFDELWDLLELPRA